jgi:hypothetical protein
MDEVVTAEQAFKVPGDLVGALAGYMDAAYEKEGRISLIGNRDSLFQTLLIVDQYMKRISGADEDGVFGGG